MLDEQWRKSPFSHTNGCLEARWVTASSAGNCVEARWVTASAQGNCVEVAIDGEGVVQVRDSKLGDDSPVVSFTAGQWRREILDPIRAGEFEGEDWAIFAPLQFTSRERWAFAEGVLAGKFDLPVEELRASDVGVLP